MQTVVVRAVYDGDKAGSGVIWQGNAEDGVNVVDFLNANVPTPEVPGYIQDKWYQWDWYGHKFDASATVRGWTNVYITYTTDPSGGQEKLYRKENGQWTAYNRVFRRENGQWVECGSLQEVFDPGKKYRNG